jgi:hypothetical protein
MCSIRNHGQPTRGGPLSCKLALGLKNPIISRNVTQGFGFQCTYFLTSVGLGTRKIATDSEPGDEVLVST